MIMSVQMGNIHVRYFTYSKNDNGTGLNTVMFPFSKSNNLYRLTTYFIMLDSSGIDDLRLEFTKRLTTLYNSSGEFPLVGH